MTKLKPFKVLTERVVYQQGNRLGVIEVDLRTPSGQKVTWTYVRLKNGVIILPVDSEGNVFLKREWRLSRKDFVWELPSGWIETKKPTEKDILKTANRELREEIGYRSNNLKKLTTFRLSNHTNAKFHIVLAQDLIASKLEGDEHEYIEVKKLPFDEAFNLIKKGQTPTAQVLIAFLMAKEILKI